VSIIIHTRHDFIEALDTWLSESCENSSPLSTVPRGLHQLQTRIGWHLLTRGFLSCQWRYSLQAATLTTQDKDAEGSTLNQRNLTTVLAGLIRTLWMSLSQLWIDHLKRVHRADKLAQSPVTLHNLRNWVRGIHTLRDKILPIHSLYFYQDKDAFLAKPMHSHFNFYIDQYLPAIEYSIQQANPDTPHIINDCL
jgi:hypothetical protein